METVKIVFDVDSKDIKSTTDELKALNKVTNDEVAAMERLSNSASDAGDGFVSLRTRVKEAKEEAVKAAEKYGEFSKEALAAKQKAGLLADQMSDLNRQVNLLNPEAKAKAFTNLAQGIVGAFGVATGALQAFGVKNKEVEQLAMQLQGALNIAQGIQSIKGLKEAYQDVKVVLGLTTAAQEAMAVANGAEAASATVAATATRGFGAALAATGIGAIVVAIGVLVGGMIALGNATESDEQKQKEFEDQLKATNQELDYQRDLVSRLSSSLQKDADKQILLAKQRGAGEQEIADIRKKSYEDSRRLLADDVAKQKKAFDEASNNSKLKWEDFEKFEKRYYASAQALRDLDYNYEIGNINASIESQQKAQEKRDQAAAKRKKDLEEQQQEALKLLKLQDDLRKQLQENTLANISDPIQRIQQERQFANEEYAIQLERLQNNKSTQEERDILAAKHTALMKDLDNDEVNANKTKNEKILAGEKKLQESLLALALAQETDPLKRAQLINDAKEAEIDKNIALAVKGSDEEKALLADKARFEIEAAKRIGDAQIEINKQTNATIEKQDKERLDKAKEIAQGIFDSANFLGQLAFENRQRETNQELQNLEDQKNKKLITEEQYQAQLKVIKRKQAEDEKKQAIFNATIDLSRAIIAALTIPPPGSITAAAFAAALAGANLAKIIATPLPKYQKGTLAVPGVDMGRDSVHAMLQPGEAVIPVATNKAYHPAIKAIYEKKISPSEINSFVMSRTSTGGRQSITANVDTYALGRALGKNKGVQIENAQVVGKVIARELSNHNIRRA